MPKPRIYRERHPFSSAYPWRARLNGLSWPCRSWAEALEKTAGHLATRNHEARRESNA